MTADVGCTISPTQATHLSDATSSAHRSQLQLGSMSVSEAGLSAAAAPQRGTQAQNAATQEKAAGLLSAQTRAEIGLSADANTLWPPAIQGAPRAEGPGSNLCMPQADQQGSSRLPNNRGRASNPGGGLQSAGGHGSAASPASSFIAGRQAAPLAGDQQSAPAAAAGCLQQLDSCCQGSPEHGVNSGQALGQAGADWGSPEGERSSCGDSRSAGVAAACSSQAQGRQPQAWLSAVSPAMAAPIGSEGAGSPPRCMGLAIGRPPSPLGTSGDMATGLQAVHKCSGAGSGSSEPQQPASGCSDAGAGHRADAPALGCTRPGNGELQPQQAGSVVPGRARPDQPPHAVTAACAEQPAATPLTAEPAATPLTGESAGGGPAAQGIDAAGGLSLHQAAGAEKEPHAAAGRLSLQQAGEETEKEPRAAAGGLSLHQAAVAEASSSTAADSGGGRPVHCSRLPGDPPRRAAEGAALTQSDQGPEGGMHGESAKWTAVDRRTVFAPAGSLLQQSAC